MSRTQIYNKDFYQMTLNKVETAVNVERREGPELSKARWQRGTF